ncbi:uncharacterized protein LOC111111747 isoform X2 [Crassostrea virginica]
MRKHGRSPYSITTAVLVISLVSLCQKNNCTTTASAGTGDTKDVVTSASRVTDTLTSTAASLEVTGSAAPGEITTEEMKLSTRLPSPSMVPLTENKKTDTTEQAMIITTTAKMTAKTQAVKPNIKPTTTSDDITRASVSTTRHRIPSTSVSSTADGRHGSTGTKSFAIKVTSPAVGGANSSADSSDSFDHELAIIFGSMLGIMLVVFFCFGVLKCYRKEKLQFQKSQENFHSITP